MSRSCWSSPRLRTISLSTQPRKSFHLSVCTGHRKKKSMSSKVSGWGHGPVHGLRASLNSSSRKWRNNYQSLRAKWETDIKKKSMCVHASPPSRLSSSCIIYEPVKRHGEQIRQHRKTARGTLKHSQSCSQPGTRTSVLTETGCSSVHGPTHGRLLSTVERHRDTSGLMKLRCSSAGLKMLLMSIKIFVKTFLETLNIERICYYLKWSLKG